MQPPRARGQNHWNATLTEDDVRLMRALRSEDMPIKLIAKKFEVPEGTAYDVCTYRTWKHLP
jgi:cell division FtsZ-interacting protein ZapD